jgi:hypothetical protein
MEKRKSLTSLRKRNSTRFWSANFTSSLTSDKHFRLQAKIKKRCSREITRKRFANSTGDIAKVACKIAKAACENTKGVGGNQTSVGGFDKTTGGVGISLLCKIIRRYCG